MESMNSNLSPVTRETLRKHFRITYKLNEEQIDLMIISSARSLQTAFLAIDEILDGADMYKKIAAIAHSLKGLLLNMGEHEWAGYAREIEVASRSGEDRDYKEMMHKLREGMQEVLGS